MFCESCVNPVSHKIILQSCSIAASIFLVVLEILIYYSYSMIIRFMFFGLIIAYLTLVDIRSKGFMTTGRSFIDQVYHSLL